MSPALIALIAQAILQYGLPAVIQIINNMSKPNPTEADWAAAFALAQTPYGLTPRVTVPLTDIGVIIAPTTPLPFGSVPPEFDGPPGTFVIVKVTKEGDARTVCNSSGNCWFIADVKTVLITPGQGGEVWQVGTVRFWVTAAALA